jgi:VIT1/CCC1 family predicted Fe2+/Mn2+ transporter
MDGRRSLASRHDSSRTSASGSLRAAVFGLNDGLVSNVSLIVGVSGATSDSAVILLAGVAGLVAGACSMAAGEWVSVRTQTETLANEIARERRAIAADPEGERVALAELYRAKGLPERTALDAAEAIMHDLDVAVDTVARERLGIDPKDLGSPWGAAASSFLFFGLGALVPLAPFLFTTGPAAVRAAIVLTLFTLGGAGSLLSLLTGRSAIWSGARMVLIGGGASIVTYGIGSLFGVVVG